jgi:GAF domain-containing protein
MTNDFQPARDKFNLHALGILDGQPDAGYEFIVHTVSEILHVPVCLISIIDDYCDRQFLLASVGLPEDVEQARETPLSHSICRHVRDANKVLLFQETERDPRLNGNLAPRDLNAKAYAGAPILGPSKSPIGAICAIDQVPRLWTERDAGYLEGFADLVSKQIGLRASLETLKIIATKKQH